MTGRFQAFANARLGNGVAFEGDVPGGRELDGTLVLIRELEKR